MDGAHSELGPDVATTFHFLPGNELATTYIRNAKSPSRGIQSIRVYIKILKDSASSIVKTKIMMDILNCVILKARFLSFGTLFSCYKISRVNYFFANNSSAIAKFSPSLTSQLSVFFHTVPVNIFEKRVSFSM